MNVFHWIMAGALILVTTCCGLGPDSAKARRVCQDYFDALSKGDGESALASRFVEISQREKWTADFARVRAQLGTYRSSALASWRTSRTVGTAGSEDATKLVYDVQYSNARTRETFVLASPLGQSPLIRSHDVHVETRAGTGK
jgi:hypothetical protein